MPNEIVELKRPEGVRGALSGESKYRKTHAVYLAAIGLATIGWFWFITWCALQLV